MIVLPRPIVREALGGQLPVSALPSDVGYFPEARFHYMERPGGAPQLILILCVRGTGWVLVDGREWVVTPGQLIAIPPGRPHAYGAGEHPWSIYWCHAAGAAAEDFGGLLGGAPLLTIADYPRLVSLFEEMTGELAQGYGFHHLLAASTALIHLLGLVAARATVPETSPDAVPRIRLVAEFLRQHPEGRVGIPELARMSNLSVSHFCLLFKRTTGFAPLDYFTRLKIRQACELLDTTALPLKQISQHLGFSDPLYFSRTFHRIQGLPPSAYRRTVKG